MKDEDITDKGSNGYCKPVDTIRIATVDLFSEPEFTEAAERIFGDAARKVIMEAHVGRKEMQRIAGLRKSLPPPPRLRIGAFDGDRLIGWTSGWHEPGGVFYVTNSAVRPEYRRQGIYTRLARAITDEAAQRGCHTVYSKHIATNNAVLIAKLRLGFVITGMEFSEELGLLVRLSHAVSPGRSRLFAERTGPLKAPE
jgi:ribosomal protein S18 acetylase RimI-like enzyme